MLYNGSETTVRLNPDSPNDTISVRVPCDDVFNEEAKTCFLVVESLVSDAIPGLVPDRNLRSARLRILDCPTVGEFCTVSTAG